MLSLTTQRELKLLAIAAYPNEACAAVTESGEVIPIKNTSLTPEKSFSFDEGEFLKLCLTYSGKTLMLWHSHTQKNAFFDPRTPSEADIQLHESSGCTLLLSAYDGDRYFEVVPFPKPLTPDIPFIQRPYIPGVFDCGTLVCDWYKKNYDTELSYRFLSSYLHKKNWTKAVLHFLESNSFQKLSVKEILQPGDILVIDFLDCKSSHGVLVVNDALQILDQREVSRLTSIEDYPEIRSRWRRQCV